MQKIKSLFGVILTFTLFISLGTKMSSCTKEVIVRDTVIIKDTVSCYDLKDGLVAWYKFTNGSLKDSSGYNNDINFNSGAIATTDRFGKAGNAFSFNGSSHYMKVPNSSSLNPDQSITMMAVVNIKGFYTGNCGSNQIFGKGFNDYINGQYVFRFGTTSPCGSPVNTAQELFGASYGDDGIEASAGSGPGGEYIKTNQWYNLIYTYENGVSKYYINGVLTHTRTQLTSFTANNQELYIGKHGDPLYPYYFNGLIDEIRIYNRAVCLGEVKELNKLKD